MTKKKDISEFATEAAESIINGNTGSVIEQLDELPKKQAMAAVAYICDYLRPTNEYKYSSFLRRLSDRL